MLSCSFVGWASLVAQRLKCLPAMWETWVRSPGEGNGNPLRYSCLKNSMDRRSLVGYCPWDTATHVSLSYKSLIQDGPSGSLFTFGQLSCFFLHTWLVLGPSLRYVCNFLLQWIPLYKPMGTWPPLLWGKIPSLFGPQEPFLHMSRQGSLSLTSGVGTYLCFSRA